MMPSNAQLRQFIMDFFTDEELVTLCFDYFPEVEQNFTDDMTINRKALALISYCDSRGRRDDLLAALRREREGVWQETFGRSETPSPPKTLPNRYTHPRTGIELIRIPAGPFQYGEEGQTTTEELPAFWIGRCPVTNAQYKRFIDAKKDHRVPFEDENWAKRYKWDWQTRTYPEGRAEHPVVLVSWHDAMAFCEWAGLELPSEQQWEKAARGDKDGRIWPWGNDAPTADHCNFNNNVSDTMPVGRYAPRGDSPYGCQDMIGNVWEWTHGWYDSAQTGRVLRGGGWYYDQERPCVAHRASHGPDLLDFDVGFRVAAPVVSVS